jgi:gamma-tubulin complex component 5
VTSRLDGLEEKFRVYNEDPLADALRERLNIISRTQTKWTPEILHLLLELSDKPVSNSKLEDLDFLKEPEPDTGPHLKWKDLAAEDPLLRDKSVWKNVDFGAESSDGEDGFEDSRSDISGTDTTVQSSIDEDFNRRPEDYAVDTISKEDLGKLRDAQFWQKTPSIDGVKLETVKKPITELQATREVLFMLGGFPTSLFGIASDHHTIEPSKSYTLKHASNDAFFRLLKSFAERGSALMLLRSFAKRSQSVPLLQVLQSSILDRTIEFDTCLSRIQSRFVAAPDDVVVSLLGIQAKIASAVQPLVRLSEIVKKLDTERYSHAFRYLELLFDETCISEMAGDDGMYQFMGRIFFECFQVYLRPLRTWMEDGELGKGDKVFFVSEAPGDVDRASLWPSRFQIRKTKDGVLHAPRFLQAAASKIFTTGKSVVVLKHLNQFDLLRTAGTIEPSLDFDTVCNSPEFRLSPFPELFDAAFDSWVQSKHRHASTVLRKTLFDSCGLHTALNALSHIYFLDDGTTASVFTNSIFDKLDTLNSAWNDRFTLTELAQSTFGLTPSVSPDHLRTSTLTLSRRQRDVAKCRRTVKVLAILELQYHLSWPIQIILTPATISSYKRIFTFLVQIRRSSHILSRQKLIDDTLNYTTGTDERGLYYSLRTRLIWFTQTLYYYLTSLVLEPSSERMRAGLKAAEDVDSMIEVHSTYIKTTIDQALLGSKLELIKKTILKILDLGIKLEDAQAANAVASKEAMEQQQEMMDLSMASLGLHTPKKNGKRSQSTAKRFTESVRIADSSSDDDDEKDINVDLSILSGLDDDKEDLLFIEKLRKMKGDFDRLVRFVAGGLKGVARAGGGEEARSWDTLGEMLEAGLGNGTVGSVGYH